METTDILQNPKLYLENSPYCCWLFLCPSCWVSLRTVLSSTPVRMASVCEMSDMWNVKACVLVCTYDRRWLLHWLHLKQHSRDVPRHWLDRTRWENVFTPSRNQFLRLFLRLWSSSLFLSHLRLCLAERVLHVHKCTGCQWCPRFHCGHFLHQASTVRICQYVKCEWTLSLSSVLILEVLVLPGDQCVYRFNPFWFVSY